MTHPHAAGLYPAPGEVVGESWVVEKILGEGGMGCVARAYHAVLHTPVALKFMNPQFMILPGAVERFINEGKASGRIKSDHVVPVMDARKLPNGTPYLVMECLEGLDLADLLAHDRGRGLPVERALHFVVQILRGLQAAHALGVVHRDMKPANCFVVTKDGEADFVKILDFGISKIDQPDGPALTRTNSTLGTPLYMSPEQAQRPRDVDARSDLYSTGAILYELLTGRAPFFSEGIQLLEVLVKLVTTEPPPVRSLRPDLPEGLAEVVHRALAREPEARYPSALAMAEALAPFASERSRRFIERMQAYRAPSRPSFAPPAELPSSLEAFSRLEGRPGGAARVHSPSAETLVPTDAELLEAPPSSTEMMPPAPALNGPAGTLVIAPTPAMGTERMTEPAPAPAFDIYPPSQARPSARRPPRRSPLVYALPAVVAAGALGGFLATRRGEGPSPPPGRAEVPAVETRPPPSADAPAGAPALAPPAEPTTDLTALATPSGAPTVPSATAKPPRTPPRAPPHRDPGFDPGIKN
ncbi:MAG TPA: protein kinase [Polyangiaceae bacterium]|nr:protein kinase [Polyangiaceae bacterium]